MSVPKSISADLQERIDGLQEILDRVQDLEDDMHLFRTLRAGPAGGEYIELLKVDAGDPKDRFIGFLLPILIQILHANKTANYLEIRCETNPGQWTPPGVTGAVVTISWTRDGEDRTPATVCRELRKELDAAKAELVACRSAADPSITDKA